MVHHFKKILFFATVCFFATPVSHAETVYDRMLKKSLEVGNIQKTQEMVNKGASLEDLDFSLSNFTFLPSASQKFLLEKGYQVSTKKCLLSYAFFERDYKTVKLLIDNGVDVNCTDKNDRTVLYQISGINPRFKDYNNLIKSYKLILRNSDQVNTVSASRIFRIYNAFPPETPLYRAIEVRNPETFKLLIEAGADINDFTAGSDAGYTPLSGAVTMNNLALVKYVISKGADVDKVIPKPHLDANRGSRDCYNCNALDIAHKLKRDAIELYLLEQGHKYNHFSSLNK